MRESLRTPDKQFFYKKRAEKSLSRRIKSLEKKRLTRRSEERVPKNSNRLKRIRAQRKIHYTSVVAPQNLSFLDNTEEMIAFISRLSDCWENKRPVWVVLQDVEKIDHGGIVVLLSVMIRFKAINVDFNGDFPRNWAVRTKLIASGFFEELELKVRDREKYKVNQGEGIVTHANKNVDSALYGEIIRAASKYIWKSPRRCQGAQTVLIELTQNTNNHASPAKRGEKHWWLSVGRVEGRVTFALVDYGVGVFTSLRSKQKGDKFFGVIEKMITGLGDWLKYSEAELLKKILNGDLHRTASGKYYRGKGLPGVKDMLDMNAIANLHIITNSVRANVAKSQFHLLPKSFHGTFIYWELDDSVQNCPDDEN